MVDKSELEELGQLIMRTSVRAEFLGLPRVVVSLDTAFSDVVRFAMEEKERRSGAAEREKSLLSEEDAGGS